MISNQYFPEISPIIASNLVDSLLDKKTVFCGNTRATASAEAEGDCNIRFMGSDISVQVALSKFFDIVSRLSFSVNDFRGDSSLWN